MTTACSKCGRNLVSAWSFCPDCGAGMKHVSEPHMRAAKAEHTSVSGGFGGLFYGMLAAPILIIVGTMLCLTGLGAFVGVPMIIAGIFAPLAGPLFGMNAHKGKCPWCGTAVSSMADVESCACPSCSKMFSIRDRKVTKPA